MRKRCNYGFIDHVNIAQEWGETQKPFLQIRTKLGFCPNHSS